MTRRSGARTGAARSARPPGQQDPPDSRSQAGGEPEDQRAKARELCLRLLTAKARTRAELAAALARRGVDEEVAHEVLARFSEVGLIDDAAFAESYVHSGHAYRGLGRRALTTQLRRRGVDEETAGAAVAAVGPADEEEMARTLVRRGLAGGARGDEVATLRRLVGMLARRGYPEGLSYRVVREELRSAGRDSALLEQLDNVD